MNLTALYTFLFEAAKTHGVSLLMALVAIFWFNKKVEMLETRYDKCNETIIELYKSDHARMVTVIDNNTRVVEKVLGGAETKK